MKKNLKYYFNEEEYVNEKIKLATEMNKNQIITSVKVAKMKLSKYKLIIKTINVSLFITIMIGIVTLTNNLYIQYNNLSNSVYKTYEYEDKHKDELNTDEGKVINNYKHMIQIVENGVDLSNDFIKLLKNLMAVSITTICLAEIIFKIIMANKIAKEEIDLEILLECLENKTYKSNIIIKN